MAKLTAALLRKAVSISEKHFAIQQELSDAFQDRYGVTYSDIDCDELIDIFDYGGGQMDLKTCDEIMNSHGYPAKKGGVRCGT